MKQISCLTSVKNGFKIEKKKIIILKGKIDPNINIIKPKQIFKR